VSVLDFLRHWLKRRPEHGRFQAAYLVPMHCVNCGHTYELVSPNTVLDMELCPTCGLLTGCSE
jgi:hypothetical protein